MTRLKTLFALVLASACFTTTASADVLLADMPEAYAENLPQINIDCRQISAPSWTEQTRLCHQKLEALVRKIEAAGKLIIQVKKGDSGAAISAKVVFTN